MYATDGDFGRVRLTSHVFPLAMQEAAACLSAAGWHRVNDRYGISRPAGGGEYLLLITVDGEGFLRLDEETHPLLPDGVAIVPAGRPHAYGVPPGGVWGFYWLHPAGGAAVRLLEYIQARLPAGRPPFLSPVDTAPYAREIEEILRLHGGAALPAAAGRRRGGGGGPGPDKPAHHPSDGGPVCRAAARAGAGRPGLSVRGAFYPPIPEGNRLYAPSVSQPRAGGPGRLAVAVHR